MKTSLTANIATAGENIDVAMSEAQDYLVSQIRATTNNTRLAILGQVEESKLYIQNHFFDSSDEENGNEQTGQDFVFFDPYSLYM